MGWVIAFFCVVGVGLLIWWVRTELLRPLDQLERLIEDLAEDREPRGFVVRGARQFMRIALHLEKLAERQKHLTSQISREEFNLRAILNTMMEGLMVVDARHVIRLVNSEFLRLLGIKRDPVGQTVLEVLRNAEIEMVVRDSLSSGEARRAEVGLFTDPSQGSQSYFEVSAVPIKEEGNQSSGVAMVFHDISRLRQLENVRREFVANVSHELRTPLSIFSGYLETLLDTPRVSTGELTQILNIMRRHSERLNFLVDDLLTLARLESRSMKLDAKPIRLDTFLEQLVGDLKPKLDEKQLALEIEVPPGLPHVEADAFRLEQVMQNLLDNAMKYSPSHSRILVSAEAQNGDVTIRVKDSGSGIPAADLPHIFERFYRVDKARSRAQGGTGLGLSIVKHIVQLHGGTVGAESDFGKGTVVFFSLPLRQAKPTDPGTRHQPASDTEQGDLRRRDRAPGAPATSEPRL